MIDYTLVSLCVATALIVCIALALALSNKQ